MKKLLLITFLFACMHAFGSGPDRPIPGSLEWFRSFNPYFGGNWTVTGSKNQWGNGMSFGSKSAPQLAAFNGSSDSLLLQVDRDVQRLTFQYGAGAGFKPVAWLSDITGGLADSNFWRKVSLSTVTLKAPMSNLSLTGLVTAGTIEANGNIYANGAGNGFYGQYLDIEDNVANGIGIIYNQHASGAGLAIQAGSNMTKPTLKMWGYNPLDTIANFSPAGFYFYKPLSLTAGLTTTGAVQAAGLTITNNATIGGNLTVTGSITSANFPSLLNGYLPLTGGTLSGALTGTTYAGTLVTNAQPNITSVGTLSNLTVSGQITTKTLSASGQVIGGALSITTPSIKMYTSAGQIQVEGAQSQLNYISASTGIFTMGNRYSTNVRDYWSWGTSFTTNTNRHMALHNDSLNQDAIVVNQTTNATSLIALAVTGAVESATISSSVTTANQPNITAIGTLTNLTVSGTTKTYALSVTGGVLNVGGSNASLNLYGTNGSSPQMNFGNQSGTNHWTWYQTLDGAGAQGTYNLLDRITGNNVISVAPTTNAVTFIGPIIKSGGTSSQFLMADGSTSTGPAGLAPISTVKTSTFTATTSDYTIMTDATSGGFEVRLNTGLGTGRILNVVTTNVNANVVTVRAVSGLINNGATYSIGGSGSVTTVQFQYDGTNWWTLSKQ